MKVLLLTALACLVSATEEPLLFSGYFNTICLASKYVSVVEENSDKRILMREVKYFKDYTLMSLTFYIRKNGKCQLHTVWADKPRYKICFRKWNFTVVDCKNRGSKNIIGTWLLRDANRVFPQIYYYPQPEGGRRRRPSEFYISIPFFSNTTNLLIAYFLNDLGNMQRLTAALARGTNITEQMWKDYVKLKRQLNIPTENIINVYEADACPKWEH